MITVLKVIAINKGERTSYYPTPGDEMFPSVGTAREFYKKEFGADRIILCYASK